MKKGIIISAVAVGLVVIYAGISSIDAYFNRPTGGFDNYRIRNNRFENDGNQDRIGACFSNT
ncbi:MAG: hypothetical protein WCI62_00185, partial [Erysipelotrichaceae bacterium]